MSDKLKVFVSEFKSAICFWTRTSVATAPIPCANFKRQYMKPATDAISSGMPERAADIRFKVDVRPSSVKLKRPQDGDVCSGIPLVQTDIRNGMLLKNTLITFQIHISLIPS
ncbi:hypothetical protein Trydic_g15842 [Trypoxylus dichotomus]